MHASQAIATTPLLGRPGAQAPLSIPAKEKEGYVFMLLSALSFALSSILARVTMARLAVDLRTVLHVRGICSVTLALMCIAARRAHRASCCAPLSCRIALLVGARGAIGGCTILLGYIGLHYLPGGDASAIYFMSSLLGMIFGSCFLNEYIGRVEVLAASVSIVGALFVADPWHTTMSGLLSKSGKAQHMVGVMAMGGSAVFAAVEQTLVRAVGSDVHFSVPLLAQGIGVCVVAALLGGTKALMVVKEPELAMVTVSAVVAVLGMAALGRGLQLCRVGPGMLMTNVEIPASYIIAFFALGETPGLSELCGATLVVTGAVVLALRKTKKVISSSLEII